MFDQGFLWAQVPIGYSLALFIGKFFLISILSDFKI